MCSSMASFSRYGCTTSKAEITGSSSDGDHQRPPVSVSRRGAGAPAGASRTPAQRAAPAFARQPRRCGVSGARSRRLRAHVTASGARASAASCSRYRVAYSPPAASSWSWVPRSATRPPSSTRIWSASRTAATRCETRMDVRPRRMGRSRVQDLALGLGVDRRQRIVQDQDPRLGGDGARQGHPLSLAARQGDAPLADHACRCPRATPPGRRSARRPRPRGRCAPARSSRRHLRRDAEGHVLGDRRREQKRLLRRVADQRAQGDQGKVVHVAPADEHRPARHVPAGAARRRPAWSCPTPVGPTIASVPPAGTSSDTRSRMRAAVALQRQLADADRRERASSDRVGVACRLRPGSPQLRAIDDGRRASPAGRAPAPRRRRPAARPPGSSPARWWETTDRPGRR